MKERVKLKVDRKLVNQAEIARRLNLSESYISKIFSGYRKPAKIIIKINKLYENSSKLAA